MPDHCIEVEPDDGSVVTVPTAVKVLIMDDEVMVRDIARDLLVHLGFEVLTVANGQEGTQRLFEIDSQVKGIVSSGY